jgi:hypothetical protein
MSGVWPSHRSWSCSALSGFRTDAIVLSDGDPPAKPDPDEEEGAEPIKPRVAARLAKELADPAS